MKNNSTIIIQARTGSSRLPGKILATIQGKPMIWHVINRTKHVKNVMQIILATSTRPQDNILKKISMESKILFFAGSERDVLDRFYQAAIEFKADPIIRITADCPLIDPLIINAMLKIYNKNNYDLISNAIIPTFPDGLDTSIFSFKSLEYAWKNASLKSEREHVVPYIIKHRKKFKIFNYESKVNLSEFRWTVDEPADLKFVRRIYSRMKPKKIFYLKNILELIKKEPSLRNINSGIIRDAGYLKSLKHDKKVS